MSDTVGEMITDLRFFSAKQKWPKGLEHMPQTLLNAATLLSEADQREKDARRVALEDAARIAELYDDTHTLTAPKAIAAGIRALQSEER